MTWTILFIAMFAAVVVFGWLGVVVGLARLAGANERMDRDAEA